ncbi:MAG: FABP family protein [Pseudoclavibacter sp.]
MFELPPGLAPELVPLAWLVGAWEGSGVVEYAAADDDVRLHSFRQRVDIVVDDGMPYLQYASRLWIEGGDVPSPEDAAIAGVTAIADDEREALQTLASETGFWRVARPHDAGDVGPGYLPATTALTHADADAVERLRDNDGAFEVELTVAHSSGVSEFYVGPVRSARIDLATDAVVRGPGAREHTASTRMYGLVRGELLWAWDIAALGRELASHASGRLVKVG